MIKIIIIMLMPIFILIGMKKSENIQEEETVYYLIRHAEKNRSNPAEKDPELKENGQERAEKWCNVLKDISFDAVYSTNYRRTLATATPTAKLNYLVIKNYDPNQMFSEIFQKETKGKKVLVVGHSDTTPAFANAILGEKKYENINDNENGALFIVSLHKDGSKTSQVLYIN